MQMTVKSQPVFTWRKLTMNHHLFCGAVFIAELRCDGRHNGYEYYRIGHAAFPDALAESGDGQWNDQPFDLKGKTFAEITDIVEQLYTAVFDKLHFTPTLV